MCSKVSELLLTMAGLVLHFRTPLRTPLRRTLDMAPSAGPKVATRSCGVIWSHVGKYLTVLVPVLLFQESLFSDEQRSVDLPRVVLSSWPACRLTKQHSAQSQGFWRSRICGS